MLISSVSPWPCMMTWPAITPLTTNVNRANDNAFNIDGYDAWQLSQGQFRVSLIAKSFRPRACVRRKCVSSHPLVASASPAPGASAPALRATSPRPGPTSLELGSPSLEPGPTSLEPDATSLEVGPTSLEVGATSLEVEATSLEPGASSSSEMAIPQSFTPECRFLTIITLRRHPPAWSLSAVIPQTNLNQLALCRFLPFGIVPTRGCIFTMPIFFGTSA